MKEFSSPALERFKVHLEYRDDHTIRSLQPFYDVKMFELAEPANPSEIVLQAFPKSNPRAAEISERTAEEFNVGVIDFFYQLEFTKESNPLKLPWDQLQFQYAYEFLEKLEPCIDVEKSKIWEYIIGDGFDELHDYLGWGFTYLIVDENNKCLILHGGYMD